MVKNLKHILRALDRLRPASDVRNNQATDSKYTTQVLVYLDRIADFQTYWLISFLEYYGVQQKLKF
jgi:hypothetical protein